MTLNSKADLSSHI